MPVRDLATPKNTNENRLFLESRTSTSTNASAAAPVQAQSCRLGDRGIDDVRMEIKQMGAHIADRVKTEKIADAVIKPNEIPEKGPEEMETGLRTRSFGVLAQRF